LLIEVALHLTEQGLDEALRQKKKGLSSFPILNFLNLQVKAHANLK